MSKKTKTSRNILLLTISFCFLVTFLLVIVVSLYQKVQNTENFSPTLSENTYETITSNFESDEYLCTGSCYCESTEERRVSHVNVIRTSVSTLVAAITTTIAYHKAKEYFSEECEKELSSECSSLSIRTEIESCEGLTNDKAVILSESHPHEESMTGGKDNIKIRVKDSLAHRYYCSLDGPGCTLSDYALEHISGSDESKKAENIRVATEKCQSIEIPPELFEYDENDIKNGFPGSDQKIRHPVHYARIGFGKKIGSYCTEEKYTVPSKRHPHLRSQDYMINLCKTPKYPKIKCQNQKFSDAGGYRYFCRGSCAGKKPHTNKPKNFFQRTYDCEAMSTEGEVKFSRDELEKVTVNYGDHTLSKHDWSYSTAKFKKEHLSQYCKDNSVVERNLEMIGKPGFPKGVSAKNYAFLHYCRADRKSIQCDRREFDEHL